MSIAADRLTTGNGLGGDSGAVGVFGGEHGLGRDPVELAGLDPRRRGGTSKCPSGCTCGKHRRRSPSLPRDLTGVTVGLLTVTGRGLTKGNSPTEVRWAVRCECGTTKEVFSSALRNGGTHTCGARACIERWRVVRPGSAPPAPAPALPAAVWIESQPVTIDLEEAASGSERQPRRAPRAVERAVAVASGYEEEQAAKAVLPRYGFTDVADAPERASYDLLARDSDGLLCAIEVKRKGANLSEAQCRLAAKLGRAFIKATVQPDGQLHLRRDPMDVSR